MALVRPESLPADPPPEREARWWPVKELPELALDHARIVDDGLWRLHARVGDKAWFVRVAVALLEPEFTLGQAQRLYEELRGDEDFNTVFESWDGYRQRAGRWFSLAEAAMINFTA